MRYEKGRKDTSRQRIIEVASERFRRDGIAATGLAGIMSEAGLTNGAFYPHFKSKAALVGESVSAALEQQSAQMSAVLSSGGVDAAIDAYLSQEHRDNPGKGCASAALLPEIARGEQQTRQQYTHHFLTLVRHVAAYLPEGVADPDGTAISMLATLIGTLELARAVDRRELSDQILAAGASSARAIVKAAAS